MKAYVTYIQGDMASVHAEVQQQIGYDAQSGDYSYTIYQTQVDGVMAFIFDAHDFLAQETLQALGLYSPRRVGYGRMRSNVPSYQSIPKAPK